MKLPDHLPAPAEVVVCDYCLRAGCWNKLLPCVGITQGNPRQSRTLTAEEVEGLAYEYSSFWHGPRPADQPPRCVEELLDFVQYTRGRARVERSVLRAFLAEEVGIDQDQVDAALEQAWPVRRAS